MSISIETLAALTLGALLAAAPAVGGLAPGALAVAPADGEPRWLALKLEAELAARPDLYLVLRVEPPELEVRARGMTLERVPLRGLAFLVSRPAWGRPPQAPPALPAVWVIGQPPPGAVRRQIEPESLAPFDPEALARAIAEPVPEAALAAEPPASYRVVLRPETPSGDEQTWTLEVTAQPPDASSWTRPFRLLADGWRRLSGASPPPPRVLSLTLDPEAARALHHLMQEDTRLLLLASGS